MTKYYVTHTDKHGERHQIGSAFDAETPEDALYIILEQSGADDDGNYEVHAELEAERQPQKLDALAVKIKAAGDLWDLLDALRKFEHCAEINADGYGHRDNDTESDLKVRGVDICELPTFGGPWPESTDGVWSWDEDDILVGEGPFSEWEIRGRSI